MDVKLCVLVIFFFRTVFAGNYIYIYMRNINNKAMLNECFNII